jgi:hypothetical protein
MAVQDGQPTLRRALLGGVRRDDAEALLARLAHTERDLETVRDEKAEVASALESARMALTESTGWSERLPGALTEFARIASGELAENDAAGILGAAVLEVAGDHLIATVKVSVGEPAGKLERDTSWNENRHPVRTTVRLGECAVECNWQPRVDAGPDTARVIEGLCCAVVCSLVGLVATRVDRGVVTQLGDERALNRHRALRHRLEQASRLVSVGVDEQSAVAHRELFGRLAWDASLADAAGVLDRLARAHGGQAYQTDDREFRLLVDADHAEQACELAETALEEYDGLIFHCSVAGQ